MSGPDLRSNHTEGKANTENRHEPPFGGLLVLAHELQVNVRFLRSRVDSTAPDIRAVEENNVSKSGNQGSKGHAVRQRKRGAKEEGRVLLVSSLVEHVLLGEDSGDIVDLGVVVKVLVGRDG